jgi:hypothetical protein
LVRPGDVCVRKRIVETFVASVSIVVNGTNADLADGLHVIAANPEVIQSGVLSASRKRFPPAGTVLCKKQFAYRLFSVILLSLWHSTNRARERWIQPHLGFSLAMKWRAGAC